MGVPIAVKLRPHTPPVHVTVWQSVVVPGQLLGPVHPLLDPPVELDAFELEALLELGAPPAPPPLVLDEVVLVGPMTLLVEETVEGAPPKPPLPPPLVDEEETRLPLELDTPLIPPAPPPLELAGPFDENADRAPPAATRSGP
jgi:hypothetical protein